MEHDSPWKEVVEDLFEAFLSFFFPHIHKSIDFSKGYQFLEKELQKIVKTSKTGRRYADKLVKVYLKKRLGTMAADSSRDSRIQGEKISGENVYLQLSHFR